MFEDIDDLDLDDGYGIDDIRQFDPNTLIKDEQDLYMLNTLSELERETIFAERKQMVCRKICLIASHRVNLLD